jgi:hypothetical protein
MGGATSVVMLIRLSAWTACVDAWYHKDWSIECKQTEELQNDKHALWVVIGELAIYTINVEHRHGVIGLFDAGDAPPIGPLGVLLLSEQ